MIETSIERLEDITEDLQTAENRAEEVESKHIKFLERLAEMLPPCTVDETNIVLQVKRLLDVEEKLRKSEQAKKEISEAAESKISELRQEVSKLTSEVERQQKQNETILGRLKVLDEKAKSASTQHFIIGTFDKIFNTTPNRPKNRLQRWIAQIGL